MSIARRWFESLPPALRHVIQLEVIAKYDVPSDEQIEEAPELISKPWSMDAMGIAPEWRAPVQAAIDDLARRLGRTKKPKKQPAKQRATKKARRR